MTLINILEEDLELTDCEIEHTIKHKCPCDYDIFKKYAQGQTIWYAKCDDNCFKCWCSEPIEL